MLKGHVAIVTGASRGIGSSIAKDLAKEGATVIVNYRSSQEAAQKVVEDILNSGGSAKAYKCNVSCFSEVKEFVDNVYKEYGKIDILVNNAGITRDNLLLRMTEDEFDDVININLKGTFNFIKHVSRYMLKQKKGKIINISSVIGMEGNIGQINYAASKAGIIGLTKAAAKEFASRGITVNAIAPGFIRTEMTDILNEKIKETILDRIALNRFGEADEVSK